MLDSEEKIRDLKRKADNGDKEAIETLEKLWEECLLDMLDKSFESKVC